jgi:hypothetical protein
MSNSTFDFFSIRTVTPDYSWDKGIPIRDSGVTLVTDVALLTTQSNNPEQIEYVGYAPYLSLSLSSAPGTQSLSSLAIQRIVDFGDFYNSDSNVTVSPTLSNEVYCHNYIMPGLYTITFKQIDYKSVEEETFQLFKCTERYCLDWSWKKRSCEDPLEPTITWTNTLSGESYEKRWVDRPEERCENASLASGGLYVQPDVQGQRAPLSWQWYNFLCQSQDNPRNTPVTWAQSVFQGSEQLIWSSVGSPCLEYNTKQASWVWNNVTCDLTANPLANNTTWDQTVCESPSNKTWDSIAGDNCSSKPISITTQEQTKIKQAMVRVLEIPPTAYLSIEQPNNIDDRTSPLTVRLSPRFVKTGSFPIEKIVWDLGDGSPLLTQRRWSNDTSAPFVFSNQFDVDWQDPRNYDVVHTYRKTPESGFAFYPSITAYASSTGTFDCASTVVGPLKLQTFNGTINKITLLQNELTDFGKVIVGEVDNSIAVWKTNK